MSKAKKAQEKPRAHEKTKETIITKATLVIQELTRPSPPRLKVEELAELAEVTQQAANGWVLGLSSPTKKKRIKLEEALKSRGIHLPAQWWKEVVSRGKRKPRPRRKSEAA
jgi:hypothetical protein